MYRDHIPRLVTRASVDTRYVAAFRDLRLTATTTNADRRARFQPAATVEAALVCFEGHRREGTWRLRAVAHGYDDGLAVLATPASTDTGTGRLSAPAADGRLAPTMPRSGLSTPQPAVHVPPTHPNPVDYPAILTAG